MSGRYVEITDTTLRDGAQCEGVQFSLEDKLKIIRALDDAGIDYIEAGTPISNPKDAELFKFAKTGLRLKHSRLAAFGLTRRPGVSAEDDAGLKCLLDSGAHIASLVGKSSAAQAREVLGVTPEENLRMIEDSARYLTSRGMSVFFDAEHFFDGCALDEEYALETLRAALRGGSARLILCDTNGGTLFDDISRMTKLAARLPGASVGIHCHNDAGLATACTLAAISAGAVQAQGTINGYGERCGNANLCEVIPGAAFKLGLRVLREDSLRSLTALSRFVGDVANMRQLPRAPYVGGSAFTHKGGMHVDGMLKSEGAFEHIDPALVGNRRRYLVSEVSGRSALMTRLQKIDPALTRDGAEVSAILSEIKRLEAQGYSFEDADGSLNLRILGALGRRTEFFNVLDFHIVSRKPENADNAQAFVKVAVGDSIEITADEGDGPINALDKALRKALSRFYPILSALTLRDFKVRVVSEKGTASAVRVHMEFSDGKGAFSTVGVSTNVIEAGFIAMTDSIDCLLTRHLRGGF